MKVADVKILMVGLIITVIKKVTMEAENLVFEQVTS
jgi:hypothetical protein